MHDKYEWMTEWRMLSRISRCSLPSSMCIYFTRVEILRAKGAVPTNWDEFAKQTNETRPKRTAELK